MPRKAASSINAIVPSKPKILPKKSPTAKENGAQFAPNSNSIATPEATPRPKLRM